MLGSYIKSNSLLKTWFILSTKSFSYSLARSEMQLIAALNNGFWSICSKAEIKKLQKYYIFPLNYFLKHKAIALIILIPSLSRPNLLIWSSNSLKTISRISLLHWLNLDKAKRQVWMMVKICSITITLSWIFLLLFM